MRIYPHIVPSYHHQKILDSTTVLQCNFGLETWRTVDVQVWKSMSEDAVGGRAAVDYRGWSRSSRWSSSAGSHPREEEPILVSCHS